MSPKVQPTEEHGPTAPANRRPRLEGASLGLTFLGLLAVGVLFVRLVMVLAFVFLHQISVPAPNPKDVIQADAAVLWTLAASAVGAWMAKAALWAIERHHRPSGQEARL